jgi:hypothetical protein
MFALPEYFAQYKKRYRDRKETALNFEGRPVFLEFLNKWKRAKRNIDVTFWPMGIRKFLFRPTNPISS